MPHIVVWNVRPNDEGFWRHLLSVAITEAVLGVGELGLESNDVSISIPHDPSEPMPRSPIVVIVDLLFDKPERTLTVRNQLARKIAGVVKELYPSRAVEVAVKRFSPEKDGFEAVG